MARLLLAVVALVAASALAGCADPPETGYVTSHTYTPGHYHDWTETVCVARDPKTAVCTVSVPFDHHDWIPDAWELCLKADPGDTGHDDEGCWSVDRDTYDRYPVGVHYPDPR